MSLEPRFNGAAGAPLPTDELRRLRRELAKERAKLSRRQADRERIANLEKQAADDPAALAATRRLITALQRRLGDAVLLDGDDAALAVRVQAVQASLENAERGAEAERTAAQKPASNAAGANDRGRQRQRQKVEDELRDIDVAFEELQRAANALGGKPAEVSLDESTSPGVTFAQRAATARQLGERLASRLALRARALHVQRLCATQALRHLEHNVPVAPTAEFEAISRDVRRDVQRALADLDRHLTVQWNNVHTQLDRLVVQRIRQTEATPEIDTSFETLAFRRRDLELLGAAMRLHLWPMIETVAQLLPSVTQAAFAKALSRLDPASQIAGTLDLSLAAPLPANVARSTLLRASTFDELAPLGRVAVPPGKLFRRGERLVATGRLLQQISRMPMMVLGPLAGLSFVGISVVGTLKAAMPLGIAVLVLSAFFAPGMLRRRAWLEEQVLLERGRAQLRECLRKRGADALQAWRKLVGEHLEAVVERLAGAMRAAGEATCKKETERFEQRRQRLADHSREVDAAIGKLDALRDECGKLRQRRLVECQRAIEALDATEAQPT